MSTLFLRKGGKLELTRWRQVAGESGPGHRQEEDVSNAAARFLFTPLELDTDVRLRDLFLLLQANPAVFELLDSTVTSDLVAEALCADPANPVAPDHDIEYLEIYRIWERDTANGRTGRTDLAYFHGVSPVQADHVAAPHWRTHHEGLRHHVAVAFSSPMVLVDLPLRINPLVIVIEANPDAANHGHVLEEIFAPTVTLGQVLHAVVHDLTTHGRAAMISASQPDPVDAALST